MNWKQRLEFLRKSHIHTLGCYDKLLHIAEDGSFVTTCCDHEGIVSNKITSISEISRILRSKNWN